MYLNLTKEAQVKGDQLHLGKIIMKYFQRM